jgi:UDP-GlcNAc:undecaprenyl-phosphate/decaprenyl-phosphate GlcNAc-1-phosphate transferase
VRGYLIVFAIAALVTAALTPLAIRLAVRFGVIAQPDAERRLHPRPTPLLGGVAMCVGVLAALFAASNMRQFHEMFSSSAEAFGVALGSLLIVGVGVLDDVWEVSPPAKLAGQVLAGSAMYLFGLTLDQLQIPFGGNVQISADLAPLFTVLWVVGMANAINLIDGLDGLAAGIVGIASVSFLLYSSRLFDDQIITGSNIGPLIAAITAGVCAGFLPFNFTPAKVFMGDAGALLLGLLVAVSTMVVGGRAVPGVAARGQRYFFFAPLLIPFLLLAVPVVDTIAAVVRRTINRTGFATADRQHIHYRLIELGHGPRRAVVILWAFTTLLAGFALVPVFVATRWALVPIGAALVGVIALTLWHPDLRESRRVHRAVVAEHGRKKG